MKFPLLTVPLPWQGPMDFHYRESKITIAIIAITILSLSTSWYPCVVSQLLQPRALIVYILYRSVGIYTQRILLSNSATECLISYSIFKTFNLPVL